MFLKVYLSKERFTQKPTVSEIKRIRTTIVNDLEEVTMEKLAVEVAENGRSVILAHFVDDKILRTEKIMGQQIVMLDFDNTDSRKNYSFEDFIKDPFMKANACFGYYTFSDGNSKRDKFRVVFKLSERVTTGEGIEKVYRQLFIQYPQADKTVGQTSRLFFGSNRGYHVVNWKNTLTVNNILLSGTVDHSLRIPKLEEQMLASGGAEILDINTPTYLLMKYKKYDLIKQKWGTKYQEEFPDDYSALNYFKSIDMVELLDLPRENPFFDILHDEQNPSGSVFFSEDYNVFFYKCFSKSRPFTGDISALLSEYLGFPYLFDSVNLLLELSGSEINHGSKLGLTKKQANVFRKKLINGELNKSHPELYAVLKRYSSEINATLDFMYDYTYIDKETQDIRYLSYFSIDTLRKIVGTATKQKISRRKMETILNIIVVTELVEKLPVNEIPKELYAKIIEPQLETTQIRKSNIYEPNQLSSEQLIQMNELAKILKRNNINVSSISFEVVYRLFGGEKASKDFPQAYKPLEEKGLVKMSSKDDNLTSKSINLENSIIKIIQKELDSKGYIFESDLISILARNRRIKVDTIKDRYSKTRVDLFMKYDLCRERMTKKIFEELKVTGKYSPKMIIYKK